MVFQSSNEFGEKQNNTLSEEQATSLAEALPYKELAASSMIVNIEEEAAVPVAKTIQEVSNLLPAKAGVAEIVDVASPDAPAAAVGYVQADIAAMVLLVNEMKATINTLLAELKVV